MTEELNYFKREFARRKRLQKLVTIPVGIVLIGLLAVLVNIEDIGFSPLMAVLGGIFLALVAGLFIFSLKNWRCPSCNAYLRKEANPLYCSTCGLALQ